MQAFRPLIGYALAAAVVVGACAPAATPAATTPSGPAMADVQELVIGTGGLTPTLDPHVSSGGAFRKYDIFETLTLLDETGKSVKPMLAKEWKLVDNLTWRFTLDPAAKFQDGVKVTSDDVVFSWKRANLPELRSFMPGRLPTVADFVAVDAGTFDVKTKTPDPLLTRRMALFSVLPKAYAERVGNTEFANKPIGSGPYKLADWRADDRLVLTAWNEHPTRKPKLQKIAIRQIPDATARVNGIKLGEIDIAAGLTPEQSARMKDEGFGILSGAGAVAVALLDTWGTDGTNAGPLVDKRVRQAINYAVDRDTLARTIYAGTGKPAGQLMQETWGYGFDSTIKPYTFDLSKARALMAEAGYANGFKQLMEFFPATSLTEPTALYIQAALREIKIDIELQKVEIGVFVNKIYKRQPISGIYLGAQDPTPLMDPDALLVWSFSGSGFGKRFNNPEFDRVYLAGAQEMDPARREALVKQAFAIIQEDPSTLPLVTTSGLSAVKKDVGGIVYRQGEDFYLLDQMFRTK